MRGFKILEVLFPALPYHKSAREVLGLPWIVGCRTKDSLCIPVVLPKQSSLVSGNPVMLCKVW